LEVQEEEDQLRPVVGTSEKPVLAAGVHYWSPHLEQFRSMDIFPQWEADQEIVVVATITVVQVVVAAVAQSG